MSVCNVIEPWPTPKAPKRIKVTKTMKFQAPHLGRQWLWIAPEHGWGTVSIVFGLFFVKPMVLTVSGAKGKNKRRGSMPRAIAKYKGSYDEKGREARG